MDVIGYRQCAECGAIHRDGRLSTEWKPGTPDLIAYCDCGCTNLRWLDPRYESVCDCCEKAFAAPGDDLCTACALLTDARDEADFHADNEQEPGFYRPGCCDECQEIVVSVNEFVTERSVA